MIDRLIIWLCRIRYKKYKKPIFYIKGIEKHYPRYLLYTEDEDMYIKFDRL